MLLKEPVWDISSWGTYLEPACFLHVIDVAPVDETTDPIAAARAIVKELYNFDPALADKPRWLVLNKMDLVPEDEREEVIAKYRREFGDETPIFPDFSCYQRRLRHFS